MKNLFSRRSFLRTSTLSGKVLNSKIASALVFREYRKGWVL